MNPKIVENHHEVLEHWALYRNKLNKAPRLITLDHHTDTSAPFRKYVGHKITQQNIKLNNSLNENNISKRKEFINLQNKLLLSVNFKDPKTITQAIELLNNDEHIITSIQTGIINSALVIAHNAIQTDLQAYLKHKVICFPVRELERTKNKILYDNDCVLESEFLGQAINFFDTILNLNNESLDLSEPYILDIDLDYLNTHRSVKPKDDSVLKSLIQSAGLVTIATEPDYVQSCSLDPGLNSEHLLDTILNFF